MNKTTPLILMILLLTLLVGCVGKGVTVGDELIANITYHMEVYSEEGELTDYTTHIGQWITKVTEECFPLTDMPRMKIDHTILLKKNSTINIWLEFNPILMPEEGKGPGLCFQEEYMKIKKYNKWRATLNNTGDG